MYAKIEISGIIEVLTGMHIGGSAEFSAIGAVDSPTVRDVKTGKPMIPGSSLKGKLRTLLARQYSDINYLPNAHNDDVDRITRLFGHTKNDKQGVKAKVGRILFSDLFLSNYEEFDGMGMDYTEVKFENTINRITAIASPRQIERAVKGTEYGLSLIYNVENPDDIEEDFETLRDGFKLLTYDYIGGSGSRGYGRVAVKDLEVNCVVGECGSDIVEKCRKILEEV